MSSQAGFYSSKREYYSRPIRRCVNDINNIVIDKKSNTRIKSAEKSGRC